MTTLVDYTQNHRFIKLEFDEEICYACVNKMMYPEDDGLDYTGTYHVFLLHPRLGSQTFILEYDEENRTWKPDRTHPWMEQPMIDRIIGGLES